MATRRIINLAAQAALRSEWKWRVGAVIYSGSRVLAIGTNSSIKTSPKSWHDFKSRHAEFNALIKVDRSLWNRSSIYVYRIGRDGNRHMAKPCGACEKMLAWAGIRRVEWTTEIGCEEFQNVVRLR